jgi:enoyl-CoA hydratase/3-hydroxyacyl-CoA dehydrogenase
MSAPPPVALSLVKLEITDGIATITVNRPEALNAITPACFPQLQQALDEAIANPEVRGIVLAGEGKVFIVGADVNFFIRNIEANDIPRIIQFSLAGHRFLNALDNAPKPVVARVHGAALGGGLEFALACDRVIASPGASFGFPETGLGIFPGFGGTQRAPRTVGMALAKWLIYTGKTLSANDALKIGIVDHVVPNDQLDEVCRGIAAGPFPPPKRRPRSPEFAGIEKLFAENRAENLRLGMVDTNSDQNLLRAVKQVGTKAPLALRIVERIIDEGAEQPFIDALKLEIAYVTEVFSTSDALLGLKFRVGRTLGNPEFQGR